MGREIKDLGEVYHENAQIQERLITGVRSDRIAGACLGLAGLGLASLGIYFAVEFKNPNMLCFAAPAPIIFIAARALWKSPVNQMYFDIINLRQRRIENTQRDNE